MGFFTFRALAYCKQVQLKIRAERCLIIHSLPFAAMEECHPEVRPKGIHVGLTTQACWSHEQTGPAVLVLSAWRGTLEKVT